MSDNNTLEVDISLQIEQALTENLKKFIDENIAAGDKERAIEESNVIIQGFLNGKIKPEDLGGIIAVRGFAYQYYVALYYILEMVSKPDKWEYLIYELGDDITLVGGNDISFIQVKTEKEDDAPHNLTQATLVKRDKGINSWLDKLFSNLNKIKDKINYAGYQAGLLENINVHFILATNMNYDSDKILAPYSDKEKQKHKDDKIVEEISKSVKDKDKNILNFDDFVEKSPQWCLERFSIHHCGISTSLCSQIRDRLINIIRCDDYEIARILIDKLFGTLIKRTLNDNLQNKEERKKFIFKRSEVIGLIEEYKQEANLEVYNRHINGTIKSHFDQCFSSIQNIINKDWKEPFRQKFSETLLWLQESLLSLEVKDPFIYERFLNRLFLLENYKSITVNLEDTNMKSFLMVSLKNIIFYMTFYKEKSFIGDTDTKFLIKNGRNSSNNEHFFTIYNGKDTETFGMCTHKIISKIDECPFVRNIREDVFCFLINNVDEVTSNSYFQGSNRIIKEPEKYKITHKYVNVKFHRYSKLKSFRDSLKAESDINQDFDSIEKPFIIDAWQQFIVNNHRGEQNED